MFAIVRQASLRTEEYGSRDISNTAKMLLFLPQNLGNSVWNSTKLSIQDFELLHAIANASVNSLSEYKPQEISNCASGEWSASETCRVCTTRFDHNGMGLFQFQGSDRCKLIGGNFQGGDAKTLRNWATVRNYFGRCKAWLWKTHIEQALRPFAQRFAELLGSVTPTPTSQNDQMVNARIFSWHRQGGPDNFGAWGTRHIFEQTSLEDLAYEFALRAKEAIMNPGEEKGGEEVWQLLHWCIRAFSPTVSAT